MICTSKEKKNNDTQYFQVSIMSTDDLETPGSKQVLWDRIKE